MCDRSDFQTRRVWVSQKTISKLSSRRVHVSVSVTRSGILLHNRYHHTDSAIAESANPFRILKGFAESWLPKGAARGVGKDPQEGGPSGGTEGTTAHVSPSVSDRRGLQRGAYLPAPAHTRGRVHRFSWFIFCIVLWFPVGNL